MEKLLLKQEDMFDHLNKAYSNYKKTPKERFKTSYIEARLENLEKLFEGFVNIHSEIVGNVKREDKTKLSYFKEDVYFQFEEIYTDYKTKMKDDLLTYGVKPCSLKIENDSILSSTKVKLPQIQLPKFSGLYEEWQTFYDMFTSLIHQNASLSAVQKMHYLKTSLTGEAETLLKNFSTTDSNYTEAFKQLTHRYNNKRYICNEIMKRLFSQRNAIESANSIKQLLDITSSSLKSLENIGIDISSWDVIINYLVLSRLDSESRKLWEIQVSQLDPEKLPSWEQLVKFLETRFRTLEMISDNKPATKSSYTHPNNTKPKVYHSTTQDDQKSNINCTNCTGQHFLYQCKQFGKQSPQERSEFVQSKRLCFNCFAPTHSVKECRSSACCRRCGRRHHTLLHIDRNYSTGNSASSSDEIETTKFNSEPRKDTEKKVVAHLVTEKNQREMLLATAVVKAYSPNGYSQIVRVLIDPCSEGSFITKATAQSLGLKRERVNGLVSGIGDSLARSKNMVSLSVESIHNPRYSVKVDAYVLRKLTACLPTCQTKISNWLDIEKICLADPNYGSAKIDIILGVEVYEQIIQEGFIRHPTGKGPIAQETQFGWILTGRVRQVSTLLDSQITNCHIRTKENKLPKQFWETEREPEAVIKKITKEKNECEQMFEAAAVRDNNGRYVVRLPFHDPKTKYVEVKSKNKRSDQAANFKINYMTKVLGMDWNKSTDNFKYKRREKGEEKRGIKGKEMVGLTLWWHGPQLLHHSDVYDSSDDFSRQVKTTAKQRPIKS